MLANADAIVLLEDVADPDPPFKALSTWVRLSSPLPFGFRAEITAFATSVVVGWLDCIEISDDSMSDENWLAGVVGAAVAAVVDASAVEPAESAEPVGTSCPVVAVVDAASAVCCANSACIWE
jgi:hypothetical protein